MKKIIIALLMGLVMMTGMAGVVQAAGGTICTDGDDEMKELAGCNEDTTADKVVNDGLKIVISAGGIVAVGVMVYGGFVYITSQGDPAKAKRGRDVILYGAVGLGVMILAFAIVTFVGANLPNPN